MIRQRLLNLMILEAVNGQVVARLKRPHLTALQTEIAAAVEQCRCFFGLAETTVTDVELLTARQIAERKEQSLAVAEALAAAMGPLGSPLFSDLHRLRTALQQQVEALRQEVEPAGTDDDWWLAEGYRLEKVAGDLVFPTSVEFDDAGSLYVLEGGFSYMTTQALARVLRLNGAGVAEIARGFRGPATSLTWHEGGFYIAEGGHPAQITRLSGDGRERQTLIADLHTGGDHFTTDLVFGPDDGAMYFGVGSATNSAVVGLDNLMSWGTIRPRFHDVPARDLKLRGINFRVPLPMQGEQVTVGAFKPLGEASDPGEVIPGQLRANAVVYRAQPDGTGLEVFADGLRNPFGLGFDGQGRLIAVDQGMDVRGARPVANDWEPVWVLQRGGWYGWPDFASGLPVTNSRFKPDGQPAPEFLLADHPPLAGQPLARLTPHSGSVKFACARAGRFGHAGHLFIAQVGDFGPMTQELPEPRGFRVVRLNPATGQAVDFYVNRRPHQGGDWPERPVALKFSPAGDALYIVDFGVLETHPMAMVPKAGSGALWRVTRAS